VAEILGEKLTGTPATWESLLREHLLEPLGISGDVEFMHIADTSRIVTPYYYLKGVLREADMAILKNIRLTSPSGGMCMSANAMIPWIQFLLGRGSYRGQQIVEAEDIERTWRPRLNDYGLRWYVGTHRGEAVKTRLFAENLFGLSMYGLSHAELV
jgi:CubicO group peptidase (beta-lactamase class C family)